MSRALTRLVGAYAQVQTEADLGVIPNSSGAATVGNADAFRCISLTMNNQTPSIFREDKTGNRGQTVGKAGRTSASFASNGSLAPSGTPGVVPNIHPFLQSLFGAAPTVVSGTVAVTSSTNASPIVVTATGHGLSDGDAVTISGHTGNLAANGAWVVLVNDANSFTLIGSEGSGVGAGGTLDKADVRYDPADTFSPLVIWNFRKPASHRQRVLFGAIVSQSQITLGQGDSNVLISFSGEGLYVLDSDRFGGITDPALLGGLTSFPTEPSAPVTAGDAIAGFVGYAVVDGNKLVGLRAATITNNPGNRVVRDDFNTRIGSSLIGGERSITVGLDVYEEDTTAVQRINEVMNDKTPVDLIFRMGETAGNTCIAHLRNVQLESGEEGENDDAITMNIPDSRAYMTSLTSEDEMTLHFV